MKKTKWVGLLVMLLCIQGCATSYITSTWKASDVTVRRYNKLMILGIIREADRTLRERMENHLVGDLKDLGYNAFSAFQEYGPKAFDGMSEAQANQQLAHEGIDAVLTVVLLDKEKERYYVPGRVIYTPYFTYQDHFWAYYRSIHNRILEPDYYEVATKYFWESNLYDLASNKLVYSVQTQSFDPTSTDGMAHEYGRMIVRDMTKNNILKKHQAEKIARIR